MTYYKVTVNGNTYEVGVEEVGETKEVKTVQAVSAPSAAPVPQSAAPITQPVVPKVEPTPITTDANALDVAAPLPGTVISVNVAVGDKVSTNQVLLIFEAMKMENELVAPRDGTIAKILVAKGDILESGKTVITIA